MARANIVNLQAGIRVRHCRGTYRTDTESGYENFSIVKTSATRIIDMDIQLSVDSPVARWILVFDTAHLTVNDLVSSGANVPYLPAKLINPGEHAVWHPRTEWTPFEKNIMVCVSADEILDINAIIDQELISSYIRYSTKEMDLGLTPMR
jgi:hypothetical protein